jgi:AraC-like protein
MSDFVVVTHIDEIPTLATDPEVPDWKPLRRHLGVGAFGVNAWVSKQAGDVAIERHDEAPSDGGAAGHEELYVVLRGAARFTAGDREFDAPAGTLVWLPEPAVTRGAIATEPDTLILAVGAARGVAFEPSDWEDRWAKALGAA